MRQGVSTLLSKNFVFKDLAQLSKLFQKPAQNQLMSNFQNTKKTPLHSSKLGNKNRLEKGSLQFGMHNPSELSSSSILLL